MSTLLSSESQVITASSSTALDKAELNRKHITRCYQADQQVKYLHLEAEIDVLIQQLQVLKKAKQ
ncbi:hypothetical protein Xen7305DRAFT_00033860 [Xenococcus sp. PCC 7305]|uniref:hypothetical protein n=1 Tax=Xenococcus sp. PCC 7305 TaxID=102125 RepID=UPI0002AC5599|nr:hypothetical protein [Xenococcus sp. PCC 7305]ELS03662.1 hypothetical protein Xen7305DRAFT_00033860 [Xenococcus sp. PCC 7305]